MSISRDKRIVEMELNNKNFESNAKVSLNTIDKLKAALKMDDADQGFYRVEKAAATVNLTPIIKGLDEIQNKFSAMGIFGIETMKRISNAAIDAGEKMWASTFGQIKSGGANRALKIANAQFKLEGLGVAWEQASKDINAAVDGTAYGFDAAANTASQLATAGIELGDAYGGMAHALKAVSGIAAMTNSSYEEIGYIFSQIAAAGRLMGQDAMQISTRGVNVTSVLAKQLGKTTEEIGEMQRKGEISFAMFAEAMNDAFGDQATKANNTFEGALSNVKSALSRIGEIWYGPFYQAAIKPLNAIRVAINNIKKAFSDGNDETRDFKDRLTDLMNIVSNIFSWLTEHVDLTFFNDIANGANKVLDAFNDVGHAIEKVLGIFKTDDAVSETEKLTNSVEGLTEAELEAAKAIWETGKYGNGQERIDNLLAAGFTEEGARRVQAAIDRFIESNYQWEEAEKAVAKQTAETAEETKSLSQAITSKFVRSFISARRTVSILGDAFKNVGAGVWEIIQMVGKSFAEVFDFEIIFKDIEKLAYRFRFFTELFKNAVTGNEKLKEIIDEIFRVGNSVYRVIRSVASIIFTIIGSLISVIKDVVGELDVGEVSISKFTDKIAEWAENLAVIVKTSGIFVKIFKGIVDLAKILINYLKKIPSILKPVADKAIQVVDTLLAKFKELTGIDLKSGIMKAVEAIKEFFNILSNPMTSRNGGKNAIIQWAEDVKTSILNAFGNGDSLFAKIKEWFTNGFTKFKDNPDKTISKDIIPSILHVLASAVKFIEGLDINKAIRNILAVGLIVTALVTAMKTMKLIDTLQKPAEGIKNLVGKIKSTISAFKNMGERVTKAIEMDLMANAFVKFAAGIAIMAGAIVALGLVDTKVLVKGLTALSICVISLAGSIFLYNKSVDPRMVKMFDTTLLQFGVTLGIMAGIIIAMGKMDYETLAKGIIMLDILTILFNELMVVNRLFRGGKNDIWKGMLALAVAMDLIIPIIKIIGEMDVYDAVKGIVAMDLIFKELGIMTVAAAFLSEKFDSLDILGIAGSMALLALAVDETIPFLELIGHMSLADVVTGILALGTVLAAMAGILVGASKLLAGTDTVDVAVIAASMGIVMLATNAMIPSILALGAMEKLKDGSVFKTISSMMTLIVGIGALLTLMSMITVGTNIALIAGSMVAVVVSFDALIPGILALAAIPSDALWKVVGSLSVLALVFTTMISILAAVNAGTAESVIGILALLGVMIGEIAFTIIAGAVALGYAATLIGKAVLNVAASMDTMSTVDGDKISYNAKKMVEGFQILAVGLANIAPKVGESIKTATSGVVSGVVSGLVIGLVEVITGDLPKILINTIVSNIGIVTLVLIKSLANMFLMLIEWITDESGGKSILERFSNALIDTLIIVLDVLISRVEEIATWIVDFVIAVVKAATTVLNTRGDEFNKAWAEFMMAVGGYIYSAAETLKETLMKVGGKLLGYMWDGVKAKWTEVKKETEEGVKKAIQAVKDFFGIREGDPEGAAFYKIGKKCIELLGDGIKAAWNGGNDLKAWLAEQIGAFAGSLLDDIAGGVDAETGKAANYMGGMMHGMVPQILWKAFRERSPSQDMWEAGKNLLLGLVNGVKDNLGDTGFSLEGLFGKLKDSFLGGENGGSFIDNLMSGLGLDENGLELGITPVLDTSSFDSDYSSFMNNYGLGSTSDYNFGTSSSLANDISGSTYGTNGFYTGAAVDNSELTASVQDIAERMTRLEVRMDTGALVGALYAGIDEKLGEKQILAGRGVYA